VSCDVLLVGGARPNFVKMKPVLDALVARNVAVGLVHTGQHYDALMSEVFFEDLGMRNPDYALDVGSGSHAQQTAAIMVGFERLVATTTPRAVVVVGDVNSTVACALVAAKAGALVVHVEAGLRSRDWAMPEEVNRVVTDRLSDLLLASCDDAVDNLRAEGYREDQVRLIGNCMIDTLIINLNRARARQVPSRLGLQPGGYGVVTLHRPSNVDDGEQLGEFLAAIGRVSATVPFVFPVHPRTRQTLRPQSIPDGVKVIDPMGYLDFLGLQADAAVVVTDSGGIQEETTALGVPCITARDSTERPVTVLEGTNRVVGTDASDVEAAVAQVLRDPPHPRCPALWDGKAGERAADAIVELIEHPRWPRPTELGC
jgi:UDP-N-acetylglucosamine 2-epimerase (non-hydrolysing)